MFTYFLSKNTIFSITYNIGDVVFIKNLDVGSIFYNVCNSIKKKSIYARSPGTYCILLSIDLINGVSTIQLPSGKQLSINSNNFATLGRNANI
jgi:ribosomal protein L2